jgi:aspartyl/asparaginyl-tRNA synthetase
MQSQPKVMQTRPLSVASSNIELETHPKVDYFSIKSDDKIEFGDLNLIASQGKSDITYSEVNHLGTAEGPIAGEKVWIRGRVAGVRGKGNAVFLIIRNKSFHTIQTCHFKDKKKQPEQSKALLKFISSLSSESIVDIYGEITPAEVKSCSQHSVELQIQKLFVVSRAPSILPFSIEDAARSQEEIDQSQSTDRPYPSVHQVSCDIFCILYILFSCLNSFSVFISIAKDTRLNNRWLDLRIPANNAMMRIRSGVSFLFREGLMNEGFIEINTPKLIAGESEGGSEVFRTDYFGQTACLAQSPQLYKQMAISADLDRVFEIGPVFRAEKSFTRYE